jgi:phage terminase Nu1 subunit (DNA packaging protein)
MMNDEIQTVNATKLAEIFDCSEREIYNLARKGLAIKRGKGFDLDASVKRFIPHLRRLVAFRNIKPPLTYAQIQSVEELVLAEDRGDLAGTMTPMPSSRRKADAP